MMRRVQFTDVYDHHLFKYFTSQTLGNDHSIINLENLNIKKTYAYSHHMQPKKSHGEFCKRGVRKHQYMAT